MSTQAQQVPGGWVISTVAKQGKQRKIARIPVFVRDESLAAMMAEARLQAAAARRALNVEQPEEEPVV